MSIFDEKTCAELAKTLTTMCVRNAEIENIHAGKPLMTKTGDYSDVEVIDAEGNKFAWPVLVASRTVRFCSTSIVRFCLPPISPEAVGRWADRGRCLGSGVNPGPLF